MTGVSVELRGDNCVCVSGDLVFATAMDVIRQLEYHMAYKENFQIDLSQVSHADSSALALVLSVQSMARRDDCQIVFINLPPVIQVLVKVARLDSIIPLK